MSALVDLTGHVFGRLTVQSRNGSINRGKSGHRTVALWLCLCLCGNVLSVASDCLRKGDTQSCGCISAAEWDLVGKKFGRLTVLRQAEFYIDKNSGTRFRQFVCTCECGNETTTRAHALKRGHTRSCGCLEKETRVRTGKNNATHGYTAGSKPAPEYSMWSHAKERAKRHSLPFDIELSDIIVPEKCPALGIHLKRSTGTVSPSSPSLDKIIPSLGYVKGNIRVISQRANSIKRDASLAELKALTAWLEGELQCKNN